jgi:hypothetical protein
MHPTKNAAAAIAGCHHLTPRFSEITSSSATPQLISTHINFSE